MKLYTVPVKFTFEGEFEINAENSMEAYDIVEKHVGLVLGGNIRHTINDEDINWEFPDHPEKKIGKIKQSK